jgi:hypothetical protein
MTEDNNNPDPIEQFFRKKSEEYDIPFREEDWGKIQSKLDLSDAKYHYARKVRWITAASILIIALLGYYTIDNHNRLNLITEQLENESLNELNPPADSPEIMIPDEQTDSNLADQQTTDETTEAEILSPVFLTESDPGQSATENKATEQIEQTRQFAMQPIEKRDLHVTPVTGFNPPENGYLLADVSVLPVQSDMGYIESESTNSGDVLSRFSAALISSPDLSTVNAPSNFHEPGYRLGLLIEYAINDRFSVSTGLVQSLVRYSARNYDANPSIYWPGGVAPNELTAECLLFDIPITIKYNVFNFEQSRFYATAGLSSYFMQNEEYQFYYQQNQPGQIQSWSDRTGNRHWFSNAGFSIGYELDIHQKWSLRAEPYIKIPISEIGWGNVNLYSMGSFFSVNYRF